MLGGIVSKKKKFRLRDEVPFTYRGYKILAIVSTVKLPVEHECCDGEEECFYETMITFIEEGKTRALQSFEVIVGRYRSKKGAVRGHKNVVEKLKKLRDTPEELFKLVYRPEIIVEIEKHFDHFY